MRNLQSVLADAPDERPRAVNRIMAATRVAAGFDVEQAAIFVGVSPRRLEDFELGRCFLLPEQLTAYARAMKEILADHNRQLVAVLSKRAPRKIRKRSAEGTARSLKAARAAKAKLRGARIPVAGSTRLVADPQPGAVHSPEHCEAAKKMAAATAP